MTLTGNSSVMKNGTQGPRKYQHNQKQLQGHTSIGGIPWYFYLLMKKKWFLVSTSRFDLPTTQFEPPPLHKRGGLRFSKLMKMRGAGEGSEYFCEKGRVRQKWRGLSRNGGLPYYIEIFQGISHDVAQAQNFDVFFFPLLTNMCHKRIA